MIFLTISDFERLIKERKAADNRALKQLQEHGTLLREILAECHRQAIPPFSVYKGGKLIKMGGVK